MQVRGHVGSRTAPHRTARQGHEAYRKVAQALGRGVTEVCPGWPSISGPTTRRIPSLATEPHGAAHS